jgi:hypothetical protein
VAVLALKDVITKGIKKCAASAAFVMEFRREKRETEVAEEGKAVHVVIKTVVFMLAGEAVERERHPRTEERDVVSGSVRMIGDGARNRAVVEAGKVGTCPI